MKNSMKKFAFAALAAVAFAAVVAHATTVSECQAIIAGLKTKTASVVIAGKQAEMKDRPGMIGKLDEASLKLDQAKFCDAIQKLNDFKVKVNQLAAAGKLNQDPAAGTTGQELLADADAAIACVNDLVTQSGTVCSF
jgi:opacity protein-like surface antigen